MGKDAYYTYEVYFWLQPLCLVTYYLSPNFTHKTKKLASENNAGYTYEVYFLARLID
jgi:hypothetical protein